jgi:hypothetical protein
VVLSTHTERNTIAVHANGEPPAEVPNGHGRRHRHAPRATLIDSRRA